MTTEQIVLAFALIVMAVPPLVMFGILLRHRSLFDPSPSVRHIARQATLIAVLAVMVAAFAVNALLNLKVGDALALGIFLVLLVVDADALAWLWQYRRGEFR